MGLYQESLFLRLSEEDREEFLELKQASQFEPMPGRIMKEYVTVPPPSLNYVSSLPPKVKKSRKHANNGKPS